MNKITFGILLALAVLVGGFFWLNRYIYNEKQADFTAGETATLNGVILAIDTTQAAVDGPLLITLESEQGEVATIAVPSMGQPLCEAYKAGNLADAFSLVPGDKLDVRGMVSDSGSIVPCESAEHYLRVNRRGYADPKNAEYTIDGKRVKLTNGVAETEAAPGSASKVITRYFGNELATDLNNDGRNDVVFLLTQESGGSGTFFYAVAALNTADGFVGSDGYLLGDRIAPQTTNVSPNPRHQNVVVVNFADRAPGEPMTARPSVGKSAYLKLAPETMQWGVVAPNFEGEADPSRMTLGMKEWVWLSALYNDGRSMTPRKAGAFTLTFGADGRFSAKTDCNSVGGTYTASGNTLTFGAMMSTKMYCEGSQESEFTTLLSNTASYLFTSRGELILELKYDSGTATFR